jgi:hypothetical protein
VIPPTNRYLKSARDGATSPAIELLGLSKTYRPGQEARSSLVHFALSVPAGEVVGVVK